MAPLATVRGLDCRWAEVDARSPLEKPGPSGRGRRGQAKWRSGEGRKQVREGGHRSGAGGKETGKGRNIPRCLRF